MTQWGGTPRTHFGDGSDLHPALCGDAAVPVAPFASLDPDRNPPGHDVNDADQRALHDHFRRLHADAPHPTSGRSQAISRLARQWPP